MTLKPVATTLEHEEHLGMLDAEGRAWNVSVEIESTGAALLGHLRFSDDEWDDAGVRDTETYAGRNVGEVLQQVRRLGPDDLTQSFRRAQSVTRRFLGLRQLTGRILTDIRTLNQVATSMRAGLLDVPDAAREIEATEQRLHEMVDELRHFAGVDARAL